MAGCRDYWSKYEHRFHISPTADRHDAIAAVELALAEATEVTGRSLRDLAAVDDQGNVVPVVTIVTDNGGPFRSFRFEAFIATHPEPRHVRTRVKTPGQNGSRERGFGSLKYERLFLEEIPDAIDLAAHTEHYRVEYNTVRPHENLSWNRPIKFHLGYADPQIPNFPSPRTCHLLDAGQTGDADDGSVVGQAQRGATNLDQPSRQSGCRVVPGVGAEAVAVRDARPGQGPA